jgi:glycosyltransferase involved in cell wall biosynthesis
MKPKRVLHVAAGNLFGGVETFLVTLAKHRKSVPELESDFAVCFEGRLAKELRDEGANVHWLGNVQLSAPLTVAHANLRLARVLATTRYDAIIAHGAWSHVLIGTQVKVRRQKLVTWAHGAPLNVGLLDRTAHWIRPDLVIVNSHHTESALGRLFRDVPKRLVYCAVDPSSPTRSRADVRKELATPDSTLVIAFAARFERWKGHDLLLRAASELLSRGIDDWCIWLCGGIQRESERAYHAELREYVSRNGLESRVRFLGPRSDVRDLLHSADVFCQPNTAPEPFGIVFIEAMYAGLPIVSTRMGGAAEIVNAECGILTEPIPSGVAAGLHRLLKDPGMRSALAQCAPSRADQLCNPKQRITELATVIGELDTTPQEDGGAPRVSRDSPG